MIIDRLSRRFWIWIAALALLVVAILVVLAAIDDGDALGTVTGEEPGSYFVAFALVACDAVMPIFPGETTLNAASTLAAQGKLELHWVIVAGALGAIVGDSSLYWLARLSSARVEPQLNRARGNDKVASALEYLDHGAPVLLVAGRYVPGLRFVINSTMGITRVPYREFLPWSALGGTLWSVYTCLLAYWVGSSLDDYPMASIVISGAITTAIMAVLFVAERRRRAKAAAGGG